jgi:hypothetical protein
MIPSREMVFSDLIHRSGSQPPKNIEMGLAGGMKAYFQVKDFLTAAQIPGLDSLPKLKSALSEGVQPYRVSHDDHPNVQGNSILAKLVFDAVSRP